MECAKCGKQLVMMQDRHYAYCPKKEIVTKFGEPYDRRVKVTKDPNSGCGALFEVNVHDEEYTRELSGRYESWRKKN